MSPGTQEAIAAVIKKMKDVGDLPIMTATIREITDLEKEETSSAADVANVILKAENSPEAAFQFTQTGE